jgi:hypothetical protein
MICQFQKFTKIARSILKSAFLSSFENLSGKECVSNEHISTLKPTNFTDRHLSVYGMVKVQFRVFVIVHRGIEYKKGYHYG